MLSSGPQKYSFEKSPRRARRLPTSIFIFFFIDSARRPEERLPTHRPANYQGRFTAPAHCWPLRASQHNCRPGSDGRQRSTQRGLPRPWWHLMRQVQGRHTTDESRSFCSLEIEFVLVVWPSLRPRVNQRETVVTLKSWFCNAWRPNQL